MEHLLTFELDRDGDQVFIHGDPEGLRFLSLMLDRLIRAAESGEEEHEHLMTPDWGGQELSALPQGTDGAEKLAHHVKIYGWPSAEGARAFTD